MATIPPFNVTDRLADEGGIATVAFKSYMDAILARMGGVTGGSYSALTDAATIVWDVDRNPVSVVVLTANRALANPTSMVAGLTYKLTVVQDATGSRTLTYGAAYKFPGGTPPTLTVAANAVDKLWFDCDGVNMSLCVLSKDVR